MKLFLKWGRFLGFVFPWGIYFFLKPYYGTYWGLALGLAAASVEWLVEKLLHQTSSYLSRISFWCFSIWFTSFWLLELPLWNRFHAAILLASLSVFVLASCFHGPLAIEAMLAEFPYTPSLKSSATWRLGVFLFAESALAFHAGMYWSNASINVLDTFGFEIGLVLLVTSEILIVKLYPG
jgi:hypothetical protein